MHAGKKLVMLLSSALPITLRRARRSSGTSGEYEMQHSKLVTLVASPAFCAALSGCGGGGSSSSNTATTAPTPTSVAYGEQNALPLSTAAKIPPGLKCGKEEIVWVNMHTKAFHDPGDPWYGKSKNGMYMCRADAVAQGDHPAGQRHTHMKSETTNNSMNNMNMPGGTMQATAPPRHHRSNPSPNPYGT